MTQSLELSFHFRGSRFNPWLGNKEPTSCVGQPKKKKSQLSSEPSVSHNLFANGGFEIIQELPKCDPEAGSEQMLLEKVPIDLLNIGLPQTFSL